MQIRLPHPASEARLCTDQSPRELVAAMIKSAGPFAHQFRAADSVWYPLTACQWAQGLNCSALSEFGLDSACDVSGASREVALSAEGDC